MHRVCRLPSIGLFVGLLGVRLLLAGEPAPEPQAVSKPVWHVDYATAFDEAARQKKMLLIVFHAPRPGSLDRHFESKVLADPSLCETLADYVCARLPIDAKVRAGGKQRTLIKEASFEPMEGRPGVAVVDLENKDTEHYQCVVTALPYSGDACYSAEQMSVVLDLPPGTLAWRSEEYVRRARQAASRGQQCPPARLCWYTDYAQALGAAQRERKMLLVVFYRPGRRSLGRQYESEVLCDPAVREKLGAYVLARLPLRGRLLARGKGVHVLEHPTFAEMLGCEGVAVLDFADEKSSHYGCVVSTFPFLKGGLYTVEQTLVILDLPPGTLTQRTLIYAVRTHPDRPASTDGKLNAALVAEAESHSDHQASIRLQGHHNWDTRFHRINARLPGGLLAREVCAESWPGENLVEAAIECVRCWRLSSGHWSAVSGRHEFYGYDMKRGSNGIWYATGIFGGRGG